MAQDAAARLGHDLGMSVEQASQASAAGLLAVEQKQAALGNAAGQGAVKQGQVTEQQAAQVGDHKRN